MPAMKATSTPAKWRYSSSPGGLAASGGGEAEGGEAVRRRHLFEFEDQFWLPDRIRNLQTEFLRHMNSVLHLYEPVVPLIDKVLERMPSRRIVDLCSGAAGPWEQLLETGWDVTVTLTDRYPNRAAFAQAQARHAPRLDYCPDPVDARRIPANFDGMRILFNGFHHFRPTDARTLLQATVDRNAAIGIFEIAERTPRTLLSVLFGVPLLVFALSPCIRPLTFSRLFWTYCVPLAPLCIVWDGLVSMLRAYSQAELLAMATAAGGDYHWECGRIARPFPATPITYLLGHPRSPQLPGSNDSLPGANQQ
jgi:hypothetical protein